MTNHEIITKKINRNFAATMNVLECVVDHTNPVQSMVVSGAPGVGKSFNICKRLQALHDSARIEYKYMNGKCTAGGLYQALYDARSKYSVLLLDDVEVFDSDDKLNLLKAALDTGESRTITWASRARTDLPTQFEFKGAVVFITNVNLAQIAKGTTNLAPHVKAVMSRSILCDLEIHTAEEIQIHVLNILRSTDICSRLGVSVQEQERIINYIERNGSSIPSLSLRTPVLMSGIIKKFPDSAEEIWNERFTD